ncbi:MAG TPA: TonB family protein [Thermoanaerobaculia bacterium]|nr:TonB family protein [Thermoanaerobaculia bacterium]
MPETEEQDLPFARSSIAAIGSRRRWRLFGRVVEDGATNGNAPPAASTTGSGDDGPPGRSLLGVFSGPPVANRETDAAERFLKEATSVADEEPPNRSMLGRLADESAAAVPGEDAEGPASMLSLDGASAAPPSEADAIGPLTQHSTIAELAGLEEHIGSDWPIERGVLISLLFHISLMLMLLLFPTRLPKGGDLFAMLQPPPKANDGPIPVILDAPGPSRPNPRRAPLSDADRRAGGGDPSKPKASTPYVPPSSGIAGLSPGPRSPRVPGGPPAPRPAPQGERGTVRQKAGEDQIAEQQKPPDAKTSEFPTQMPAPSRGQPTGPREIGKLAGLDRAIQEAARSAAGSPGGEGGAPQGNPDGGFLDSGPLSFDTKWYDWGAYASEMIRRIKLHWDVPELARLGWKGSLTVRFYIRADGTVQDARIIRYSGIPPFDNAALQAILKSSPFRPLPEDLHEEREGVTVTFLYNMRVDDEGRAQ